ncbi:unnamed protein product [Caenorhabditis auriculariae]|uniref:Phospholipid/glycerol acyltransferase domain-containing protein n=1 Tax=Caenorhabditis auriculariae TaxID=2777116 RepID=A0A8S1HQ85_9PELO|nr:unnamed protein product [Caenorhabditis auriculariae]
MQPASVSVWLDQKNRRLRLVTTNLFRYEFRLIHQSTSTTIPTKRVSLSIATCASLCCRLRNLLKDFTWIYSSFQVTMGSHILYMKPKKPCSRFFSDLRYTISTPLPHTYPSVRDEVFSSKRVSEAIERVGNDASKKSVRKRAMSFFFEIRASLSRFVCKICAYMLYKVFRRLMTKLLVDPNEISRVQEAEKTGVPLVYLPLHKSHMDYLLITWCAWHFNLRLPHIASGDNLNLSGFGWLLRATGAFFIRRRINPSDEGGKDALYRAVLHSYIEQLLKKGMSIEFFPEGTRSRFGKALMPKNGLISNVVEAVQQGTIKDCYLVPVAYTYDAVYEGIFLNELMGLPKERESLMGVVKGVFKGFSQPGRCGVVRMHYGQPFLLTDYLMSLKDSMSVSRPVQSALTRLPQSFSYRELVPWHHQHSAQVDNRSLIRAIGFHSIYDSQVLMAVSLVSVVSAILLAKFREGIELSVLALDSQWLCDLILADGGEVMGYRTNETSGEAVVQYAIKFISDCLEYGEGNFVKPIGRHRELIHLAYNRNALLFRFALKSALAISLVSQPRKPQDIALIVDDALSICEWMQFEVVFCRPCENLRDRVYEILGKHGWCSPKGGPLRAVWEDDGFDIGEAPRYNGTVEYRDERAHDMIVFFSNLLRPFLQSLYMLIHYLDSNEFLLKEVAIESKFIRNLCQRSFEFRAELPFDPFLEAINSDSFKNGLRILRHKGFVSQDETKVTRTERSLEDVSSNLERVLRIY